MSARPERELVAYLDRNVVGRLREEAGVWSFEYDRAWTTAPDAFDLAPALARQAIRIIDGSSARPVQWFFDNLLPEEAERELLAREAKLPSADAFGLLAYYGAESVGALTLLAPGAELPAGGLVPLADATLHERIGLLPAQSLSARAPKHMSTAGAQHKLPLAVCDGAMFEPVGATASTHILKPDHRQRELYPHSAANEFFTMRVAAALDLPVPATELRRIPDTVYLVARFDRAGVAPDARRRHVLDACQLLALDRAFKYHQMSAETLVRCVELCRARAAARQALFRWTVFNVLLGNGDAHLKNLSFYLRADGVDLAPHYDLVCTALYDGKARGRPDTWTETELSVPIGKARRFGEVTRDDVVEFGRQLGVSRAAALRIIDRLVERAVPAAQAAYAMLDAVSVPDAARAAAAGELRHAREIRHLVVEESVRRFE